MRLITSTLLLFLIQFTFAQEGRLPSIKNLDILPPSMVGASYQEITEHLDKVFASIGIHRDAEGRVLDNDYIKYQRWKHYWYYRLDENGNFPSLAAENKLIQMKQKLSHRPQHQKTTAQWEALGPFSRSGGYWGMGRVMAIAFHPTDPDIFYVGAAKGGIWKTTDGGASYTSIGEELPYNSVSNIVIDPQNPQTLIVSLGDRFGWWSQSIGIYRTDDEGNTWNPTSLTFELKDRATVFDMKAHPAAPNEIYAATSEGVYKSIDGQNFQKLSTGLPGTTYSSQYPRQIVFHPSDANTVYVSCFDYWNTTGGIYKSTNGGSSWGNITGIGIAANTTITLATTPISPDKIYAKFHKGDDNYIRLSTDAGQSWTQQANANDVDGELLYVSPNNDQQLYSGYFYIWASGDAGANFSKIAAWDVNFVHVDQWVITHNPLNDRMYWGNDGGVYDFNENTQIWRERNFGLAITQMYGISIAQDISGMILMGSQDNGGAQLRPGLGWTNTNGGDAMGNAIDPNDHLHFYTTYPLGIEMYRTRDGFQTHTRLEDRIPDYNNNADWNTPVSMSPHNSNHIWTATNNIYLSTDDGESWVKRGNNVTGELGIKIKQVRVSPADSNRVYAFADTKLYLSTNYGASWRFRSPRGGNISNIYLHPTDANSFWLTIGGYSDGSKVMYSNDAGQTFQNISGNLPNIPALSILYDDVLDTLYLGTELGVFKSSASNINWQLMNNGLPLTEVTDLELHTTDRKLYAATYGRGVYELQLESSPTGIFDFEEITPCVNIYPNPVKDHLQIDQLEKITELNLMDLSGKSMMSYELKPGSHYIQLPKLAAGLYLLQARSDQEAICVQKIRVDQ